jgi:transcriptional antiterminator NusG
VSDHTQHSTDDTAAPLGSADAPLPSHSIEPSATESPELKSTESAAADIPSGEAQPDSPVEEELSDEPVGPVVHGAYTDDRENVTPLEEISLSDVPPDLRWYILKVQSNREESIREGLLRRVAMAGLERFVGEVIVPIETVSEFRGGKKRVVKRKLYPGYLVVHMEINEDTWFLVRETPGIGDFTGSAGKPTPMSPTEVSKILAKQEEKTDEAPKLVFNFAKGDRVKISEGNFENFEGDLYSIDEANGRVTVMIYIFGRSTPVELEFGQIEKI